MNRPGVQALECLVPAIGHRGHNDSGGDVAARPAAGGVAALMRAITTKVRG